MIDQPELTQPAQQAHEASSNKSLLRNGVANFVGKIWSAVIGLVFVPFYIRLLGIESYGLIGFFATLQAIFALFDLGLSTTLNRELALLSLQPTRSKEARNLVRTLEVIYWVTALLIAVIVFVLAPLIATKWVNAQSLSTTTIQQSVFLMGLAIALHFPFALYSGGLLGLQRQVLFNGITVSMVTLQSVGAVLVLWLIEPSVIAFFSWQVFVNILQTIVCAWMLWRILPTGSRPRFEKTILTTIWRFAAGMAGISILSLLLMELDKIILSTFLPLVSFGYYNLAAVVASGISVLTAPLFTAVFPRLTQLVAHNDQQRLIELYHTSCQLLAVCVLSTGVTLATFAPEVLLIWTGDTTIVQHTWPLVSLLVIGTTLNGLMNIPYALQLAYGWTRLALYQNIIAVVLLVPLLIWITNRYGAVGAACIWPLLNAGYVLFGIQAMHTRLLPSEKIRWYTHDVGLPLLGALLGASLGLLVIPVNASRPLLAIYIGAVLVASLISAFAFTAFSGNRMWWRILSFVRRG